MKKILIKFRHGMGDNVQLQIPLKHIKSQKPDWVVDIMCYPGRKEILEQHCHRVFDYYDEARNEDEYDVVYDIPEIRYFQLDQKVWHLELPATRIPGFPQSWPVTFIDQLGLHLEKRLFYYELDIKHEWVYPIMPMIKRFCYHSLDYKRYSRSKYAVIHFQGTTNSQLSYFAEMEVTIIARMIYEAGFMPIVLDFDKKMNFYSDKLLRADIPKNAGSLAAFIARAGLFVGIDSGPLHLAACTNTPSLALWEHTSPMYLHGFSQNVIHYKPGGFGPICPEYRTTNNYMETLKELLKPME